MYQRGIRGAITVDSNSIEEIKKATIELISELKQRNKYKDADISNVIFTMTQDLDAAYPAKFAREEFETWQNVPMMCVQELNINGSLPKCLRILIVINTDLAQNEIKHVYLKGAEKLRKDLK